ncbi:MAG: peptidase M28 family protein [Xanthomonadales bacterium PRO6]|nr:peptidase M28 family protein [Xanthomonadales bacterium PRO6]
MFTSCGGVERSSRGDASLRRSLRRCDLPVPLRSLFLLLAFAGVAGADPLTDADFAIAVQLREQALAGSSAYAIVESLTTEVGHRMAGSANDAKGRAWAVAKFRELGYSRVWVQPVRFPVWERGFENAAILSPRPQPLNITALGGSIGTPPGGVRGAVVRFETAADLEAAPRGSLASKIAYVANRMQRARDGSGYGAAVIARAQGAIYAARAGASAVLIRSIGTDEQSRTPHTGQMRYDNLLTRIPAAALASADADAVEAALAQGTVEVKLELGSRKRQGEYTSANVIGEIPGSEFSDEVVVIGGHLDSWDLGTGAIDNGVGVAITMSAGALIGRLPQRPRRSIRVVAFANEEQGVYGGKAYARQQAEHLAQHVLGAESDFGGGRIWRLSTRVAESALPIVERMYEVLRPLGIERGDNLASGGADLSAMRDLGMPIIALGQDGTRYFDWHHSAQDTLDKLHPEDLDYNVAVYAAMAYLAAQAGPVFGPLPAGAPRN